jgi:hypothetical protein
MIFNIQDIIWLAESKGSHFFERDAMRFFRSKVQEPVFQGPGGIFFLTSERFVSSTGEASPRRFTVRQFDPETGGVSTVGEFNKLTRGAAHNLAARLAHNTQQTPEGHVAEVFGRRKYENRFKQAGAE